MVSLTRPSRCLQFSSVKDFFLTSFLLLVASMALCNKLRSLTRPIVSPNRYMLNSIRFISCKRLFVGGLSYGTDDQSLKDAFSGFGDVIGARVITDRDSRRSRGFGFVDFESSDSAKAALSAMDGQELQGRNIRVNFAKVSPSRPFNSNSSFQGNKRSFNNES